jgi:hypothetical protein
MGREDNSDVTNIIVDIKSNGVSGMMVDSQLFFYNNLNNLMISWPLQKDRYAWYNSFQLEKREITFLQ